jgi:hypothetical protein
MAESIRAHDEPSMHRLPCRDFIGGHLALSRRWLHILRPRASVMSHLPHAANIRTVLVMRTDEKTFLNVKLTFRDRELLEVVAAAGFLTTRQVHRQFFRASSLNACQKRLRKLATSGHLAALRLSRTEQQLWRLGRAGIRTLTDVGRTGLVVPKRAPANLSHTAAINDLRLWVREQSAEAQFFAEWELQRHGWHHVIPDAMVVCKSPSQRSVALAIEVDLATENPGAFARMKLHNYESKLPTPVARTLVLVPHWRRLKTLVRHLYGQRGAHFFAFAELPTLLTGTLSTRAFVRLDRDAESLATVLELLESPHQLSSHEDTLEEANV